MTDSEKIINIIQNEGGIVRLKKITEQNINKYHLQKLVMQNIVEKVQHGIYKLSEHTINDFVKLKKIVPKGIICLYSAWSYYELTTYFPHEFHVAIEKKSKVKIPQYPPIKLYYWENPILQIGVNKVEIDKTMIEIFDIEKSVSDAVKFRNKIGKDILIEILTNYLKRSDKNIDKLIKTSKLLKVERILKNYLDILI